MRRTGPALLLVTVWATLVVAHGTHDARLAKVNDQLREEPTHVGHLSARADLLIRHGDYAAALADCDAIALHHPNHAAVHGLRARAYLAMDDPAGALVAASRGVDAAPEHAPEHAAARRLRSQVLIRLSRFGEAAMELGGAVELDPSPSPDDFLELARLRLRVHENGPAFADGVQWAVDTLDRGCTRLGPLPALHLESIRILRDAGQYTDAIARTYGLAKERVTPSLLALRGDLLRDAGRVPEAMVAYSESLSAIDELGGARRFPPAIARLRQRVRDELGVLEHTLNEATQTGGVGEDDEGT